MSKLIWVSSLLTRNMALLVVAVGIIAAYRPELLTWVAPHVSLMLGLVMLGMGMTLRAADFREVLTRPREVAIGVGAQFLIMPLLAALLARVLDLPPELAAGVILVGTSPGGTASNVICYLARGDVALSVALTMTSTILAPVVTPVLTYLLAGAWIEVSLSSMMLSIAEMVLLPLAIGLAAAEYAPRLTARLQPVMPLASVIMIVLLVGGVVALSGGRLLDVGALALAAVVLHNGCGLALGYTLAQLSRLDARSCRTVAIEVGMQNSGLAASLAVMYFSPVAAIPAAIFSVWHNVSGAVLASLWSRTAGKNADAVRA